MDDVVFGPGRFDGAGKGEDVLVVESIVVSGVGGEPFNALFNRLLGVVMDKCTGISVAGVAANMLQAPVEGLHTPVVVGGPAAVLVAADFTFKPVHGSSRQLTVYSRQPEKQTNPKRRCAKSVVHPSSNAPWSVAALLPLFSATRATPHQPRRTRC